MLQKLNLGTTFAFIAVCLLAYQIFFSGNNNDDFETYLKAQNTAFELQADKILDSLKLIEGRLEGRIKYIQALDSSKQIIQNYYQLKASEVDEIFSDSLLIDRIRRQIARLKPARFD